MLSITLRGFQFEARSYETSGNVRVRVVRQLWSHTMLQQPVILQAALCCVHLSM
jgi:hypothetical protein